MKPLEIHCDLETRWHRDLGRCAHTPEVTKGQKQLCLQTLGKGGGPIALSVPGGSSSGFSEPSGNGLRQSGAPRADLPGTGAHAAHGGVGPQGLCRQMGEGRGGGGAEATSKTLEAKAEGFRVISKRSSTSEPSPDGNSGLQHTES